MNGVHRPSVVASSVLAAALAPLLRYLERSPTGKVQMHHELGQLTYGLSRVLDAGDLSDGERRELETVRRRLEFARDRHAGA